MIQCVFFLVEAKNYGIGLIIVKFDDLPNDISSQALIKNRFEYFPWLNRHVGRSDANHIAYITQRLICASCWW